MARTAKCRTCELLEKEVSFLRPLVEKLLEQNGQLKGVNYTGPSEATQADSQKQSSGLPQYLADVMGVEGEEDNSDEEQQLVLRQ